MLRIINLLHSILTKKYPKRIILIAWTCLIVFLSLADFSKDSEKEFKIPHLDKVAHVLMYFSYTYLLLAAQLYNSAKYPVMVFGYSLIFGILMEILQHTHFIHRSGDFFDFAFNFSGSLIALILYPFFVKKIRPR
jgi:VanZ family protein